VNLSIVWGFRTDLLKQQSIPRRSDETYVDEPEVGGDEREELDGHRTPIVEAYADEPRTGREQILR
jgi:hypothetical protein